MNRKEFTQESFRSGLGCCALLTWNQVASRTTDSAPAADPKVKFEKEFVENWLSDLLEAMEAELDHATRVNLMERCGRACFRRFPFKQDIANQGKGSLQNLIDAYKKNFEIWRAGEQVHIRYGETSSGCYCPAARYRPARANDLHCECTRSTHQMIFETALGRPFKVEIVESLRRGGKTCHFAVHLS